MKQAIYWLAKYTGVFFLSRWLTRDNIRILAYHGIWLGEEHFGNFLYMSAEKFDRRMQKLKDMGLPVLSLDDALKRRDSGNLPKCTTVLTIDDGWYGTYLHMIPRLEQHDFPATLYITTYYCEKQVPVFNVMLQYMFATTSAVSLDSRSLGIENGVKLILTGSDERAHAMELIQNFADSLDTEADRQKLRHRLGEALGINYSNIVEQKLFHLVSPKQVADMARRHVDIQLHTHRHRISKNGVDCIERELQDNRSGLESLVGKPLTHFCYPSGVYDTQIWPKLEALNIDSATTTEAGFVHKKSHRYALPRILDGEQVTDLEFEAELSGFLELKRQLFARLKKK